MIWIAHEYSIDTTTNIITDQDLIAYDDENLCMQETCNKIITHMNNWPINNFNTTQYNAATFYIQDIKSLVANHAYDSALMNYGTYQDVMGFTKQKHWYIWDLPVISPIPNISNIPTLKLGNVSIGGNIPTIPVPNFNSQIDPIVYGAICRKCNDNNPYAISDKSDGTYICRQCNIFNNIFNSP